MNPKITVLTPTYNRSKYLEKLYESLKNQTNKNFEWFIIDDGSEDETEQEVDKWKEDKIINITYMYKENGGKHKALNLAIKHIDTVLTFIVDSDDWLTEDAIETIEYYYNKYKDNKKIGGFSFLRKYSNGTINGREFPKNELIDNYINVRINANMLDDKAEVYYTEILKQYPFPEFEGEKFISEDVIWIPIAKKYDMVHINKAIYIGEYLEEGLTKSDKKIKVHSPLGMMEHAKVLMYKECCFKSKCKGTILYTIYGLIANKKLLEIYAQIRKKFLFILLLPISIILYEKWKKYI